MRNSQNEVVAMAQYREVVVCGDWMASHNRGYKAFASAQRWNGWVCPHFTFEVAKQLAIEMPGLQYDDEMDQFVFFHHEGATGSELEQFTATTIDVDGTQTKVFAIGAWSWCWEPFGAAAIAA
jgi:hypothetical protein